MLVSFSWFRIRNKRNAKGPALKILSTFPRLSIEHLILSNASQINGEILPMEQEK